MCAEINRRKEKNDEKKRHQGCYGRQVAMHPSICSSEMLIPLAERNFVRVRVRVRAMGK